MESPLGVSPAEAGRLLGLGRTTIYRLIRNKRIHAVKVGSRIVVPSSVLLDLIAEGAEK